MMIQWRIPLVCGLVLILFFTLLAPGAGAADLPRSAPLVAQSVGEKIGEGIDKAIGSVKQGWKEIRSKVDQMGVEARVYARLRWDKALTAASIAIDVQKGGATVLRGTVPSESAKAKAEQLAADTVGVDRVENQLKVVASRRNE